MNAPIQTHIEQHQTGIDGQFDPQKYGKILKKTKKTPATYLIPNFKSIAYNPEYEQLISSALPIMPGLDHETVDGFLTMSIKHIEEIYIYNSIRAAEKTKDAIQEILNSEQNTFILHEIEQFLVHQKNTIGYVFTQAFQEFVREIGKINMTISMRLFSIYEAIKEETEYEMIRHIYCPNGNCDEQTIRKVHANWKKAISMSVHSIQDAIKRVRDASTQGLMNKLLKEVKPDIILSERLQVIREKMRRIGVKDLSTLDAIAELLNGQSTDNSIKQRYLDKTQELSFRSDFAENKYSILENMFESTDQREKAENWRLFIYSLSNYQIILLMENLKFQETKEKINNFFKTFVWAEKGSLSGVIMHKSTSGNNIKFIGEDSDDIEYPRQAEIPLRTIDMDGVGNVRCHFSARIKKKSAIVENWLLRGKICTDLIGLRFAFENLQDCEKGADRLYERIKFLDPNAQIIRSLTENDFINVQEGKEKEKIIRRINKGLGDIRIKFTINNIPCEIQCLGLKALEIHTSEVEPDNHDRYKLGATYIDPGNFAYELLFIQGIFPSREDLFLDHFRTDGEF